MNNMSVKQIFVEFLETEKYRISLSLGECQLETQPLGEGEYSLVFKGSLNGSNVAIKFFLFDGAVSDKEHWLNSFKKKYLTVSLLETRNNIAQYADYDVLHIQDTVVPVLVMKQYKCSLEEYRSILSADIFLKLFCFLTNTMHFLHSMGLNHHAIKPHNILVDDHNDFVLADIAFTNSAVFSAKPDIMAIGRVLQWYAFGGAGSDISISKVFPNLELYNRIVERCLSQDDNYRFHTIDEIIASADRQVEHDPQELMQEFNLICRKNFPKELPEYVHCSDQKKISKLFGDFEVTRNLFNGNLVYLTDVEKHFFSPSLSKDGYIKFDDSAEFKVLDIWIHCDNDLFNDYILVHHANTLPEKVNGKEVYRWAVYEEKRLITWEEAINGFAENDGDIVPLDRTKIEFFNRIPREGYVFIALNQQHNLVNPANNVTLRDYFFRFSFNYVNRYILEDMNNQSKLHMDSLRRKR